jgi:hypothetical protein
MMPSACWAVPQLRLHGVAGDADAGKVGVGELELGRWHAGMGGDLVPAHRGLHRPLVRRLVARSRRARRDVAQRQRRLRYATVARLDQPALRGGKVALDADALAQRQTVAQAGLRMAFLCRPSVEIGRTDGVGSGSFAAFVHGAAQRIERLRITGCSRLLEPGTRVHQIARNAQTAHVEDAEIDLCAQMAGRGGLLEELERARLVARRAGESLRVDQRQTMCALGGASIGGPLNVAQAIAVTAAIEQDCAEPRLGIGIARRHRPEGSLRRAKITGTISDDGRTQIRSNIRAVLLCARDAARGDRRRKQRHVSHDHLVLKV